MEAENRSTHQSAAVLYFAGKETLASLWSVILLVLTAGITSIWIGVLGFGLMRLIEHALALL
jgi:hypothetical protein